MPLRNVDQRSGGGESGLHGAVYARSVWCEQGLAALQLAAFIGDHFPNLDSVQPRKNGSDSQKSPLVTTIQIQIQSTELLNPETCSGWREKAAAQRLLS